MPFKEQLAEIGEEVDRTGEAFAQHKGSAEEVVEQVQGTKTPLEAAKRLLALALAEIEKVEGTLEEAREKNGRLTAYANGGSQDLEQLAGRARSLFDEEQINHDDTGTVVGGLTEGSTAAEAAASSGGRVHGKIKDDQVTVTRLRSSVERADELATALEAEADTVAGMAGTTAENLGMVTQHMGAVAVGIGELMKI